MLWVLAMKKIPLSTGPMQGVHPAAKAIPSGNAPATPGRTLCRKGRRSAYNAIEPRPRAYPIISKPRVMTTSPAIV